MLEGKVILVTGASSGIGQISAQMFASLGHRVYGAARRVEKIEKIPGVNALRVDVTDTGSIREMVDEVLRREGRIDVLVNNAGYGYLGPIETVSMEDARRQMEVNLFGLAEVTRLVVPHMREQGSGRIVNISSIAGKAAFYYGGWYNVSKYSVEAFSDNLRMDLRPFGIKVSIIEPGPIKTAWGGIAADNLEQCTKGTVYEKSAKREAEIFRRTYDSNIFPESKAVAKAILKASLSRRPRLRYKVGFLAKAGVFLHAVLPGRWWDAIVRQLG